MRPGLARVRMQRVQAFTFLGWLLTIIVVVWMFGRNSRLVDFFEKLTFRPNCTVLPHISHMAIAVTSSRSASH